MRRGKNVVNLLAYGIFRDSRYCYNFPRPILLVAPIYKKLIPCTLLITVFSHLSEVDKISEIRTLCLLSCVLYNRSSIKIYVFKSHLEPVVQMMTHKTMFCLGPGITEYVLWANSCGFHQVCNSKNHQRRSRRLAVPDGKDPWISLRP